MNIDVHEDYSKQISTKVRILDLLNIILIHYTHARALADMFCVCVAFRDTLRCLKNSSDAIEVLCLPFFSYNKLTVITEIINFSTQTFRRVFVYLCVCVNGGRGEQQREYVYLVSSLCI